MTTRKLRGSNTRSARPGPSGTARRARPAPFPFEQVLTLQRNGRLADAEAACRQILKTQPNHFDGLHLLGVLEAQRGDHAAALEHIDAALSLKPDSADVLNNRGMVLQGLGRLDEALASFDEALSRNGASPGTLFNRGGLLVRLSRFNEALASFDKAIALKPDYLEAVHDRGYVLFELKRVDEALASFDAAIALKPNHARALNSRGLALRAMGRLDDALASFEKAIALAPGNAGALFNRGLVLAQQGRLDEALASYDKALALQPNSVGYNSRSVLLKDLGQLEAALASCDKALSLDARNPEARNNRGNVLTALGRLDQALVEYDRALAIKPDYADAYVNRGIALLQLERHDDALASYDMAISIEPTHSRALNNRGFVLTKLSRPDEALASYDRAIALKPDYSKAFFNRAVTLAELKRFDEALESYDRAIVIEPSCAAFNNRGVVLKELGRFQEALASYDRALQLEPTNPEAYSNRGVGLRELGRNTEALREFDKAIDLRTDYSEAYSNRGTSLMALKRIDDALASYDRALQANPANAEAYKNRGICRLLAGRLSEGWADYDWRWKTKELLGRRPKIRAQEWQGESLAGKRLVVYGEQGLGDIIQFARYVPQLVALGASVTLLVRSQVARLLKPLTKNVSVTNKVGPEESFDYFCALLSVPRWLTGDSSVPSVPYLRAEEELVAKWNERVGAHGFKVGIAWQGSPHGKIDSGRSIQLSNFVRLARVPGTRLISLQKEHGLEQLANLPEDITIERLGADFDSGPDAFIDTAAVMMNLDLIITSDTSIVHLAGALGRPTWVALKYVPDWRWMLDREDSPWYPTMRLFRQKTDGDWQSVFEDIESELSRTIAPTAGELKILPDLGITPTQSRAVTATTRSSGTIDDAFAAGLALHKAGQLPEAESIFRAILKDDAEHFHALHSLGLIAQQRGNSAEALHLLDAALAINPTSAGALYNRAVVLVQVNCWKQALESLDKVIALDPSRAVVWSDRGVALKRLMRLEEALESYDQAVALDPSFAEAFSNRGNILKALGRFDEALKSYDKAISLKPNYADAVKNRGMCKLLCGDLATGWDDYEARWDASDNRTARPAIDAPIWQAEELNGKSIIIHAEQGLGDTIQFSRYLPLLVQRNARVTFLVRSKLAKLLEPVTKGTRVIFSLPESQRYDFQCGLMSIPRWLSRDLAHIPARVPYLTPSEDLVSKWKARLGEKGFRIGIAWQGSPGASIDQGRSIPLKEFAPLARIPGVRLISLQKEHGLEQLADIPPDVTVERLGSDLDNGPDAFLDTAAVMTNLDLVITSDTSIAHLAGALGCRTWALLRSVPDWRWMLNREDSPWYPTMRVFRQDKAGDWQSVFAKVNVQLLSLVNKPHQDPKPLTTAPGVLSQDTTLHLERAARLHGVGQLDQANQEYNLVLGLEPQNFEALHRKGVIAFQCGNLDEALAFISAALSVNPLSAEAFNNHGLVLMTSKRSAEALESFERAIALDPSLAEAFYNRGIALLDLQRLDEALQSFDHALTLKPDHIEALNHRGNVLLTLERYADALETFDHALRLDPGRAKLHNNRGLALNELGRLGESIESFDRAILLQPNYSKAFKNRGSVLTSLGRHGDALASCERAVELDANDSDAFVAQGNVLKELKRLDEALSCFDRAIILNPANPQAFNSRANTLVEQVRLFEAIQSFDKAISLKPGYAAAIFSRGVCKLLAGNYSEGWEDYEARWDISKSPTKRPPIRGAIWRGENLSGRRIAVHCEQGLGDIIQFVRYLPLLVDQGAQVTFAVLPKLARVLKKATNGTRVAEKIEGTEAFDYVSALMSLPLWLSRDIEAVPKRVPYLEAETALVSQWKERIGEHGFKIGIAWQGSRGLIDVGRSIPASHFTGLARIPGVRLISLQKEDGADLGEIPSEIECLPKDFDGGDDAFVDTAAVMSCLDLVITSDTSIAHLAGALGKPTWVALKNLPDWRWMLGREDSPWYPTMRLFRQQSAGDWEGVFSRIKQELTLLASNRSGATSQKENGASVGPRRSEIEESYARGTALHQAGRLSEAATAYDNVLRLQPGHFDALHLKGVIALQRGDLDLAVQTFDAALHVQSKSPNVLNNRGLALTRLDRLLEAVECFDQAIAIDSTSVEFFLNRGIALMGLDRLEESITNFSQAIALNANYAEAYNQRGSALIKQKGHEEAIASIDRAIAISPANAKAHNNRAIALRELGRSTEALESCNRAIAIDPNYAKAHITRGVVLKEVGRLDDAIASYDRALALKPDADAFKNRGMALLFAGKYREGWKDYDWRWDTSDFPGKRPDIDAPLWMGETVTGKRIVIYVEQGNGDIIQFSRYLPLLVRNGAIVTLLGPPQLTRLLAPVTKNVRVVSSFARSERFEFHCALMSLPRWFDTTVDSIPSQVPYLTAEADLIAHWKAKIGQQGFKIGIAWQGSPIGKIDNGRSMPLSEFTSLARIPGVRLISLQKEHGLEQVAPLPKDVNIELLGEFDSGPDAFVDTAAVMANLDLIITSDTSIAHLAGALGRPTWLALKQVPDWRWLREREDSPWYPTMRLFRQRSSGDWRSVFLAIERELGVLIREPATPKSLGGQATGFDPSDADAHLVRGNALKEDGRPREALASYDRAIKVKPDYAEAYNGRGNALMELGRLKDAIASYDRAVDLLPQYGNAIYNRGLCKLLDGNYREGWADFEWRWGASKYPIKRPNFNAPVWRGEAIAGRRIIVYSEQGLGDVVQFSRYLPLLVDQGADITFAALPKMERVLKMVTAGIRVVGMIEYSEPFDYSCALLSLPLCLGTNDVASVPNQVPYLEAEDALVAKWKARIGSDRFKVGIAWQGSPEGKVDRDRSIPLVEFAPLSRAPGVRLISLQKQHGLTQLSRLPEDVKIELLGDDFDSGPDGFIDTAAVMANLDLVITSDTSIAHLAGALGRPTWLALKSVPDWRWMLEREDSPWYPTMRLFRQEANGDWKSVFTRIRGELLSMIKTNGDKGRRAKGVPAEATPASTYNPEVQVSWGELMDKISILEIKRKKLTSVEATANVQRELAVLQREIRKIDSNTELATLRAQLQEVNEALWDVEDRIRAKEANKSFDGEFVELARSVYFNNDKRGTLKRRINQITSSELVEEKQYTAYRPEVDDVGKRLAVSASPQSSLFDNANLRIKKCRHGAMIFHTNDMYIGRSLNLYGEFSEGEVELFKQFIRPGMTVIDVGANIGAHTLYFAEAVGSAGRVFAFEPQQVLYQILCGNIALNLLRNVTPINAGLGSVSGSITVPTIDYAQGGNFGGVALGRRKSGDQVPLRTLDSYDLESCHLIKIDVEGMERDVLEGATSILKRHEPILYVENDRAEKSKDLIQWLFDRDYRAYWHTPALFNPKNHFGLKENVFGKVLSINMLCIPRSKAIVAKGFREITSVDASWQTTPAKSST